MGNLLLVELGIFGAQLVVNLGLLVVKLVEGFGTVGVTLVMQTFGEQDEVDLGTSVVNYWVWTTGAIGTGYDRLLLS